MRITIFLLSILSLFYSCGVNETVHRRTIASPQPSETDKKIDEIKQEILALQGTQAQLDALVKSDFYTCPLSGDTANVLINTMCKVSQYANNELRVELKGQLAAYTKVLDEQIKGVNDSLAAAIAQESADVTAINATLATINSSITTINTNITALASRMTTAESAIATLQTQVNGAIGAITGAMTTLDIGTENMLAGPLYESILRSTDKSKINAYVEASLANVSLGNNPLSAVNGSYTVTVNMTAHGLLTGDSVYLSKLVGTKGFTNADINGFFVVESTPNADSFTITASRAATSGGAFGSNVGLIRKLTGRGLATIWKTADGADSSVRTTNYGSKNYNFIIKSNGDVCYDKTNNAATFTTINAGGTNITCK